MDPSTKTTISIRAVRIFLPFSKIQKMCQRNKTLFKHPLVLSRSAKLVQLLGSTLTIEICLVPKCIRLRPARKAYKDSYLVRGRAFRKYQIARTMMGWFLEAVTLGLLEASGPLWIYQAQHRIQDKQVTTNMQVFLPTTARKPAFAYLKTKITSFLYANPSATLTELCTFPNLNNLSTWPHSN